MAYPFAGFGSFLFALEETAIFGTDTGWNLSPSVARQRPLGSASDTTKVLAVGSAERSFELWLSPDRFASLQALLLTTGQLVDWERPVPDARTALMLSIRQSEWAAVRCSDGTTQKRIRAAVAFITQGATIT